MRETDEATALWTTQVSQLKETQRREYYSFVTQLAAGNLTYHCDNSIEHSVGAVAEDDAATSGSPNPSSPMIPSMQSMRTRTLNDHVGYFLPADAQLSQYAHTY